MIKLPSSLEKLRDEGANAYANTDPVIDIERAFNSGFDACAAVLLPQNESLQQRLETQTHNLDVFNKEWIEMRAQLDAKDAEIADLKYVMLIVADTLDNIKSSDNFSTVYWARDQLQVSAGLNDEGVK